MTDGVFAVVNEVEESTDFRDGERDEAPVDGWRGFRFRRRVGQVLFLV